MKGREGHDREPGIGLQRGAGQQASLTASGSRAHTLPDPKSSVLLGCLPTAACPQGVESSSTEGYPVESPREAPPVP